MCCCDTSELLDEICCLTLSPLIPFASVLSSAALPLGPKKLLCTIVKRVCWLQQRRSRNDMSGGNENTTWRYTPGAETTCSTEFIFLSEVTMVVVESSRHPLTSKAIVQLIATIRSISSPGPFQDASKQVPNAPQLTPLYSHLD